MRHLQEKLTIDSGKGWYVDEDDKWIWGMFYYNPNDSRFTVNARVGVNATVNLAHPAGKVTMALVALLMFLIPPSLPAAVAGVILLGAAGGFFSLPTGIATQERPAKEMLGRCIATSNFLDCGAMILSSVMLWLMGRCGVDAPGIILAAGICILIFLPWTGFKDAAEKPQ
jgi:hypothetical protein